VAALVLALGAYFSREQWLPRVVPPPAPILGTGDVQATLTWDSANDLDLWVTDPAGETIYWDHLTSASDGRLDVDANANCREATTSPVENIFWPTGDAPSGSYTVFVYYYKQCETNAPTSFHVRLLVDGQVSEYDGTVAAEKDDRVVTAFER